MVGPIVSSVSPHDNTLYKTPLIFTGDGADMCSLFMYTYQIG